MNVSEKRAVASQAVPTLDDVARRAGVSTATVSRCLNNPSVVQEATRERVQSAIRHLGYSPNFGARALAAKRTNTVGAIVPTLENAIFARGLEAFQRALAAAGITLLVSSSLYRPEIEEEQIRTLVARGADALLLIGYDRDPAIYEFLATRGIPYVIAWAHDASEPHPAIGFENRTAMRQLAERVLELGHRRLGMISAERAGNDRALNRWIGVCEAMQARGLAESDLALFETTYAIESGRDGFRDLVGRQPRPTAILCGNDVLAAGALSAAHEIGLRVPEDVSITGFDDIEIAQIVTPGLTTVHVPHREMGRRAAEMLIAMRDGRLEEVRVRLDADIRIRRTLGPPPSV